MRYLTILSIILLLAVSCQNSESKKAEATDTETTEAQAVVNYLVYELSIEGMTCTGCEETIEAGVKEVEGIGSVEASHIDGTARLEVEEGKIDTTAIRTAIEAAGYKLVSFSELTEDEPVE